MRKLYPELRKQFYEEHSNVTSKYFSKTKFGIWVNIREITEKVHHDSGRTVEKTRISLQIEKAAENSDCDLTWHVFSS